MPMALKNASAIAVSAEVIYLIGGQKMEEITIVDEFDEEVEGSCPRWGLNPSIYQYLISCDTWHELSVELPVPTYLITPVKISDCEILLLGGLVECDHVKSHSKLKQSSMYMQYEEEQNPVQASTQAFILDLRGPTIEEAKQLATEVVSVHEPFTFFDENNRQNIWIVNESEVDEEVTVIKYIHSND